MITLWLFNIAMENDLIEIDGLPIKNGWIFPWRTVSHNQRVNRLWFILTVDSGYWCPRTKLRSFLLGWRSYWLQSGAPVYEIVKLVQITPNSPGLMVDISMVDGVINQRSHHCGGTTL